jgi:hypothetical protein
MTLDNLTSLDGFPAHEMMVHVPAVGVWFLTCVVSDDAFELSERKVTAMVGSQAFVGTIDMDASGEFVAAKRVRVIGGAAGWRKTVARAGHNNDAGVKRQTIATALAKQTGEILADVSEGTVGIKYAWKDGIASSILESICPDWRVGYDGLTYLNPPASSPMVEGAEVTAYDKHAQTLTLGLFEDIPAPGMTVTDERFGTVTIRALTINATGDGIQAVTWFGAVGRTRLGNAIESLVKATHRGLFGRYRYRVVSVGVDKRVNLQAFAGGSGLPDLNLVEQSPGLPGWESDPTQGAVCHVQFLDGDPSLPVIVGYDNTTPVSISFGGGTKPIARVGDMCQVSITPATVLNFQGTVAGEPAVGIVNALAPIILHGIVSTGQSRLRSS